MNIGLIDADLLKRKYHRFPNLALEKISGHWKSAGEDVQLLLDYDHLDDYDQVYVSKVFTDTEIPDWLMEYAKEHSDRIHLGGTGFYFDKAPNLPYEIEHQFPDYHLYDDCIKAECEARRLKDPNFNERTFMFRFKEYTDYSVGFITRGCFRKCKFCVNQKYDKVFRHSQLEEFYDPNRKKICLLDDNILGYSDWKSVWRELINTGKPFKFKQGMDERLLTDKKCEVIFNAKYDGSYTFAFDNVGDYDLIHRKLKLIRKYTNTTAITFYVLVGFEGTGISDIENMWKRVALLMQYRTIPYIMRYQNKNDLPWDRSEFREMYITMARWCNQPSIFKKKSFREFCELNQIPIRTEGKKCVGMRVLEEFETKYPDFAKKYFDMKFSDF